MSNVCHKNDAINSGESTPPLCQRARHKPLKCSERIPIPPTRPRRTWSLTNLVSQYVGAYKKRDHLFTQYLLTKWHRRCAATTNLCKDPPGKFWRTDDLLRGKWLRDLSDLYYEVCAKKPEEDIKSKHGKSDDPSTSLTGAARTKPGMGRAEPGRTRRQQDFQFPRPTNAENQYMKSDGTKETTIRDGFQRAGDIQKQQKSGPEVKTPEAVQAQAKVGKTVESGGVQGQGKPDKTGQSQKSGPEAKAQDAVQAQAKVGKTGDSSKEQKTVPEGKGKASPQEDVQGQAKSEKPGQSQKSEKKVTENKTQAANEEANKQKGSPKEKDTKDTKTPQPTEAKTKEAKDKSSADAQKQEKDKAAAAVKNQTADAQNAGKKKEEKPQKEADKAEAQDAKTKEPKSQSPKPEKAATFAPQFEKQEAKKAKGALEKKLPPNPSEAPKPQMRKSEALHLPPRLPSNVRNDPDYFRKARASQWAAKPTPVVEEEEEDTSKDLIIDVCYLRSLFSWNKVVKDKRDPFRGRLPGVNVKNLQNIYMPVLFHEPFSPYKPASYIPRYPTQLRPCLDGNFPRGQIEVFIPGEELRMPEEIVFGTMPPKEPHDSMSEAIKSMSKLSHFAARKPGERDGTFPSAGRVIINLRTPNKSQVMRDFGSELRYAGYINKVKYTTELGMPKW